MQSLRWLPLLGLLAAAPAIAAEPACPLDLTTCLSMYQRMKERPWLGVEVDRDSLGRIVVHAVRPGTPAQRAGIRSGDVLQTIEGMTPPQWFAGKAGWKDGDEAEVVAMRSGRTQKLELRYQHIPEDVFAKIIGVHMIEGHLAHMHKGEPQSENH